MKSDLPHDADDLSRIYAQRFAAQKEYRRRIWRILIDDFFGEFIEPEFSVLDLGCGYGEFINRIRAARRFGMDLNQDAAKLLEPGVEFLCQDCSQPWPLPENSLDVVFTSNFFEHLPDKRTLGSTLDQVKRALKPGGKLIAMGPNVKHVPGGYWDFWDHYLPLTELSLGEALGNRGMRIERSIAKFLPYTMARGIQPPPWFVGIYLRMPFIWPLFGRQFLVVAVKPQP
jgi:SAM-dependent methyltransferase